MLESVKLSGFSKRGVTLVELMVMSVIASLVALTVIQGFSGMSRSVIASRFRTLATQLANQKMQSLKSTSYYRLRVSSQSVVPSALAGFSPPVRSDDTNYTPTSAMVNGISFTNYVVVERVEKDDASDTLTVKAWNSPDTGLKQITVNVVWQERGSWKRLQLTNLLENPNRLAPIGDFVGTVTSPNGTLLGASVSIVENATINTLTDAMGTYRMGAPAGTYTLRASKRGYFDSTSTPQVLSSSTPQVTVNFFLAPMSSGTVSGSVWQNDHLVISRVCGEKMNGGVSQEYVELFNPTTWTWVVDGQVGLTFQRQVATDPAPIPIGIDYSPGGSNIAPGGFYLFASTTPLNINGTLVGADAVWESSVGGANDTNFPYFDAAAGKFNIIPVATDGASQGAGVLTLTGPTVDQVGWQGGGGLNPAFSETAPVPDNAGIETNEIYYRKSDVGGLFSSTIGPAYDSGNNSVDWAVDQTGGNTPPRNTGSAPLPVKSGTPSAGAMIFANDGLSQMVQAALAGSPPQAQFTLPSIATGTWTVSASSGNFFLSYSTTIFAAVNYSTSIVMNTSTIYGFVSGRVMDAASIGISGITLSPGAAVTDASGNFNVALSPGVQTLTANPGGANPSYMDLSQVVTVTLGQVLSNTIYYLNGAGKITGLVTIDGTTPLPNVSVSATNNNTGFTSDTAITASDGTFLLSVPVGVYTVLPTTALGETVSPITQNVNVSGGVPPIFVATYTVTSAYGTLSGRVTSQGVPINTGVLIIASTAAVPGTLLDIDTTFRGSGAVYYTGASKSDGSYSFDIQNGTYTVSAWYTSFSGNTPTATRKDQANVIVLPRQTTTLDLAW